jgi:hypothetical protein
MSVSDIFRTKAVCDMGQNEFEISNCLVGAVKDFISYHHSDVQAKELCAMYAGSLKDVCLSTTESYYHVF